MPYKVDSKNCYNILIIWTSSGHFLTPIGNQCCFLYLLTTHHQYSIHFITFKLIDIETFSTRQALLCSLFSFQAHKTWNGLACQRIVTILSLQSTCNLHSNHLRRWIGPIHVQYKSVQCAFCGDANNLNQCTFTYFRHVDRP